jgi:hypothetical protein
VLAQLIAQSTLVVLILLFVISFVDQREFNVTERRPHYLLVNGTLAQVPYRESYPLQTDITTIISFAFNILGKFYTAWIAVMTWNYAFLLLEKNGMRLETLSSMISLPAIPALWPPPGFEAGPSRTADESITRNARRRLSIGVLLIMLSAFPASFSSPLLTGSINWRASFRNVSDADIVTNIGLGVNGDDINPWSSWATDVSFRPRYIHRASALATHAWDSVNDTVQDPPTFKRVIPSLQNLPVETSLETVTVPWFNIESFSWITSGSDISAEQFALLASNATPGVLPWTETGFSGSNPLQNSLRTTAILPDTPYASLGLNSSWSSLQPVKLENQTAIVAINVDYAGDCDAGIHTEFGDLPSGIYMNKSFNAWDYSNCFVFARITYNAGVATCYGCSVVSPIVVESPPSTELTLEADVMTLQAMYVMADVIGELVDANITLPPTWDNIQNYTTEMLTRGYTSAWTAMSELIAFYTPYPSTPVTIPITMSRAFVDRRRVWGWLALQVLAFVGGAAFLMHICANREYPIVDPLLHGFMLDVIRPEDRVGRTWPTGFKDTFITWERERDRPAFSVRDFHQPVRFAGDFSAR